MEFLERICGNDRGLRNGNGDSENLTVISELGNVLIYLILPIRELLFSFLTLQLGVLIWVKNLTFNFSFLCFLPRNQEMKEKKIE